MNTPQKCHCVCVEFSLQFHYIIPIDFVRQETCKLPTEIMYYVTLRSKDKSNFMLKSCIKF